MKLVFRIDGLHHNHSSFLQKWHPSGLFLATAACSFRQGSPAAVFVFERSGRLIVRIELPPANFCCGLEWDYDGNMLAILLGGASHEILLWDMNAKEVEHVELSGRDPVLIRWSKTGSQMAIGTNRGDVLLYDRESKQCWHTAAKHKKRVTCGDWNVENKFAFASDDRQISIATADGSTFGQVKVKSRPTNVKFGGNRNDRENIVSVSMDRKTILLYNLDDSDNALELAFQQRYGHIVSFEWFRGGLVMVAFSLGFLVVISTQIDEIGREQFCARLHKDELCDMAYCAARHQVATCGDGFLKIVSMTDWKEVELEHLDVGTVGPFERLQWTANGELLSLSTKTGNLYVFATDNASMKPLRDGYVAALSSAHIMTVAPAV